VYNSSGPQAHLAGAAGQVTFLPQAHLAGAAGQATSLSHLGVLANDMTTGQQQEVRVYLPGLARQQKVMSSRQ
jgi:hypothetical protein